MPQFTITGSITLALADPITIEASTRAEAMTAATGEVIAHGNVVSFDLEALAVEAIRGVRDKAKEFTWAH